MIYILNIFENVVKVWIVRVLEFDMCIVNFVKYSFGLGVNEKSLLFFEEGD